MRRRTLLTAGAGLAAAGTGAALAANRSNRDPVPHESVQTGGGSAGTDLWLDGDLRDRDHAPDARWGVLVTDPDRLASLVAERGGAADRFLAATDLTESQLLFLQAELPAGASYTVQGARRAGDDRVRLAVDAPWPPTDGAVRTLVVRLTPDRAPTAVDVALSGDVLPVENPAR